MILGWGLILIWITITSRLTLVFSIYLLIWGGIAPLNQGLTVTEKIRQSVSFISNAICKENKQPPPPEATIETDQKMSHIYLLLR